VAGTTPTTVYHDTWFDNLAIGYLSRQLQAASGSCLYTFASFAMIHSTCMLF
jgi:hypothetical protein